mgnify:CR=1 FL=1
MLSDLSDIVNSRPVGIGCKETTKKDGLIMPDSITTRYFLGANSAHGFFSLYDGFAQPEDGVFLHVIKGGPGCGKSSFMKRIGHRAEKAGQDVEYISCSGDPDSLDGVWIPALGVAYADGTAPHVLDPAYPGGGGSYLDLGAFYDEAALRPKLEIGRAHV